MEVENKFMEIKQVVYDYETVPDETEHGLCDQTRNVVIGRCNNCNYSDEVYFDGEKWKYRCMNLMSPMSGDYVEGNWSCKKFLARKD